MEEVFDGPAMTHRATMSCFVLPFTTASVDRTLAPELLPAITLVQTRPRPILVELEPSQRRKNYCHVIVQPPTHRALEYNPASHWGVVTATPWLAISDCHHMPPGARHALALAMQRDHSHTLSMTQRLSLQENAALISSSQRRRRRRRRKRRPQRRGGAESRRVDPLHSHDAG